MHMCVVPLLSAGQRGRVTVSDGNDDMTTMLSQLHHVIIVAIVIRQGKMGGGEGEGI